MADDKPVVDDSPRIIDDYKLVAQISQSGNSQIWEVIEQRSPRNLAMKLLNSDSENFKANKAGLKYEAKIAQTLEHPNIIKVEGFYSSKQYTYMLMEYFRSQNLKAHIKNDLKGVHARIRRLLESTMSALAHIHMRGWIHRDIKPDNILFNKASEVKLIDFSLSSKITSGLGKLIGGNAKVIQGTRTYIAPETIRKKAPTIQTDMYSLGITIFEILTGKPPFMGSTPRALLEKHCAAKAPEPSSFNSNVTPEMDRMVLRLLEKKPSKRYGDMGELLAELKRISVFKVEVTGLEEDDSGKDNFLTIGAKLDSRTDAARQKLRETNPELVPDTPKPKPKPAPAPAAKPPSPPRTAQPQPGYGMPAPGQPMPQYYYPPGFAQPMPYGQQMPYGQPAAYGQPPGFGQPPGYPPQGYPQQPQGYPQQPYPGPQGYPPPQGYRQPPGYVPPPGAPPQGQPSPAQQPQKQQSPQPTGQPPQQPAAQQAGRPAAAPQAPQQGAPPAPASPPARPPQQPAAPPPAAAQPQSPPAPPKKLAAHTASARHEERHASQNVEDDDLPEMTELPDIF